MQKTTAIATEQPATLDEISQLEDTAINHAIAAQGILFLLGIYFENFEQDKDENPENTADLLANVVKLGVAELQDCAIAISTLAELRA